MITKLIDITIISNNHKNTYKTKLFVGLLNKLSIRLLKLYFTKRYRNNNNCINLNIFTPSTFGSPI